MEFLIIGVVALVAIAFATVVSSRVGVAAPLILVGLGIGASLLPFVPEVRVNPELILAGVLPPLLYAAGIAVPTTDFRREFRSIGALSVLLTIVSTVALGFLFHWLIPGLALPWAFALGAIVSPTDAVATGIIKRLGVSPRVVSLLEGESLLNDATALVLLRSAIAAAASAVTLGSVAIEFVIAMAVAVAVGWLVGRINLWASARITDVAANTVFSFSVPFLASVPAELLGGSGLVAAVVAGLITGSRAARVLSPQVRQSQHQTWRALEFMLEGAIYLILGLELIATIGDVERDHLGIGFASLVALATLAAALAVRGAFIAPVIRAQQRRAARAEQLRPHLSRVRTRLEDPAHEMTAIDHVRRRLTRVEADISYLLRAPLGAREGGLMVWAGMRGVVTVAAAQTLPTDTPARSLLVLIAYFVAVGSLVVQGGLVTLVVRVLKPSAGATAEEAAAEREELRAVLAEVATDARRAYRQGRSREKSSQREPDREKRGRDTGHGGESSADERTREQQAQHLAVIEAKRDALLDARSLGTFSSAALSAMLAELDAEQIRLQL